MESCSWGIFGRGTTQESMGPPPQPELNEILPKCVIVVEAYTQPASKAPPDGPRTTPLTMRPAALGPAISPRPSRPPHGSPSRSRRTSQGSQHAEQTHLLKGASCIIYDTVELAAGNYPLPGLESIIGLVNYLKELREVMPGSASRITYRADNILRQK